MAIVLLLMLLEKRCPTPELQPDGMNEAKEPAKVDKRSHQVQTKAKKMR